MDLRSPTTYYDPVEPGDEISDDSIEDLQHSLIAKEEDQRWSDHENGLTRSQHFKNTRRSLLGMKICPYRWILDVVLLLVILILILDRSRWNGKHGHFEGAGDITGFAPASKYLQVIPSMDARELLTLWTVAQQIRRFVPDLSFVPTNGSDFFTAEVRRKWLSIVPSMLDILNHVCCVFLFLIRFTRGLGLRPSSQPRK